MIVQVPELELPSVIICPKNPDALNFDALSKEILKTVPNVTLKGIEKLIGYAIADAGFINMDKIIRNMSESDHNNLIGQMEQWRGRRTLKRFFEDIFEKWGYKCGQVRIQNIITYKFKIRTSLIETKLIG